MTEKVEYNVRLQGSDGKEYIISYDSLKFKVGFYELSSSIRDMHYEIMKLRDIIVKRLLVPEMEDFIVTILKENPNLKTRELNSKMPYETLKQLAWYQAFDKLKDEGRIVGTSHGKGQNRTWSCVK